MANKEGSNLLNINVPKSYDLRSNQSKMHEDEASVTAGKMPQTRQQQPVATATITEQESSTPYTRRKRNKQE